jgi:uncharacterized protein YukE
VSTENWNGISSTGIDKLMTDFIDYAEKSNKIINQIDEIVEGTASYFKCESGDTFRSRYSQLNYEAATINKNILSYNTDFLAVKSNYGRREEGMVAMANDAKNAVKDVSFKKEERL